MTRLVPLSELREADRDTFGGKAVSLGRMMRAGLPVPRGFALAFGAEPVEALSPEECEAIRQAYAELATGTDAPLAVAVRSSAVGEDGGDLSFAGMHTSLLDVVGEAAVMAAVVECLASQESERARAYREEAGAPLGGKGVAIQCMVPAEYSGICFSRSPTDPETIVVECVSGLAEGLAAGTRTPSRIHFARHDLAVRSTDDAAGLLERIGLERVREVARLALRAEACFGTPLDVEWAMAGGACQLVQARPITAGLRLALAEEIRSSEIERLRTRPGERVRVWTDFSVADMFSRPTPLDVDLVGQFPRTGGGSERAMRRVGMHPAVEQAERPPFECIAGRVYLSMDGLIRAFEEDLPIDLDTRRLPKGHDLTLDPTLAPFRLVWPGWRGLLRLPALLLRLVAAPMRIRRIRRTLAQELSASVRPRARAEAEELRKRDLRALSDRELWETFRSHVDRIVDLLYHHQLTDIVSIFLHQLLRLRLRWLYGPDGNAMLTRLITGLPGNLNTETNLDLARVARGELDRETFFERYGHRGNPDWQLSAARWREDPSHIETMIQAVGKAERDPSKRFEEQTRVREEAEREFSAALKQRGWGRLFHRSILSDLRDYQLYSPQRETSQGLCYLFVELARNAVLEAARRSDLGDLVFYFKMAELEAWLMEGRSPDLLERVRERRRHWRVAHSLYIPHVVRSDDLEAIGQLPPLLPGAKMLTGQVVASGRARGCARVVQSLDEAQDLQPGEILVAASADPAWTPLFLVAGGAVLEQGGLLSHPAIVAREYGLPAVVNVAQATRILRTGQMIHVDADRGLVWVEEEAGA
jgi:pyruvate,water dikinase